MRRIERSSWLVFPLVLAAIGACRDGGTDAADGSPTTAAECTSMQDVGDFHPVTLETLAAHDVVVRVDPAFRPHDEETASWTEDAETLDPDLFPPAWAEYLTKRQALEVTGDDQRGPVLVVDQYVRRDVDELGAEAIVAIGSPSAATGVLVPEFVVAVADAGAHVVGFCAEALATASGFDDVVEAVDTRGATGAEVARALIAELEQRTGRS